MEISAKDLTITTEASGTRIPLIPRKIAPLPNDVQRPRRASIKPGDLQKMKSQLPGIQPKVETTTVGPGKRRASVVYNPDQIRKLAETQLQKTEKSSADKLGKVPSRVYSVNSIKSILAKPPERTSFTNLKRLVRFQLFVHYFIFIILMILYSLSETSKYSRHYGLWSAGLFTIISFGCIEIGRLYGKKHSQVPLYISMIPLLCAVATFHNQRLYFLVIWPIHITIMILQTGSSRTYSHIIVSSLLCSVVYLIGIGVILVGENCIEGNTGFLNCLASNNLIIPNVDSKVHWNQEVFLIVVCFYINISFLRIKAFIDFCVLALRQRENNLSSLKNANQDLLRQLRKYVADREVDLVSPITKILNTLKEILDDPSTSPAIAELIEAAIKGLASDHLFAPQLLHKQADEETQKYLQNVLRTSHAGAEANSNSQLYSRPVNIQIIVEEDEEDNTLSQEANEMLANIESPDFDVHELKKLVPGNILRTVGNAILQKNNMFGKFGIDKGKFDDWIQQIGIGYNATNAYHNALHAADATVIMNYFLTRYRFHGMKNANEQSQHSLPPANGEEIKKDVVYRLSDEEVLAGLVGAMIHDYRHPGFNNAFLINTSHPIALRYNDNAVLEQYHVASCFELMAEDKSYDFLSVFTHEKRKMIRDLIIAIVLGTDMASHFEYIGRFKNKFISQNGFDWEKPADRKLVLIMAMKASDINNITKPTILSNKWTQMYSEEVFHQGDEEKRLGLPISPFMNRDNFDLPKSQIGFIDYVVKPLYEPWVQFVGKDIQCFLDTMQANRNYWVRQNESHGPRRVSLALPAKDVGSQIFAKLPGVPDHDNIPSS